MYSVHIQKVFSIEYVCHLLAARRYGFLRVGPILRAPLPSLIGYLQ